MRHILPGAKPSSRSLRHHLKLSTAASSLLEPTTAEQVAIRENCIYTHLLDACLQQCKQIQSRRVFDEIPQRLSCALQACKTIQAQSLKHGFTSEGRLANAILDLYAKCGDVGLAEKSFSLLLKRDCLSWNSILSMHSRGESPEKVLESFRSMRKCGVAPNQFTYAMVLSACARLVHASFGKQVHCNVVKLGFESDSFCEGSLIDMYSKCGNLVDARRIFDKVLEPDAVSGTAMILGYVQVGLPEEGTQVFEHMQKLGHLPDQVGCGMIINAYLGLRMFDKARLLFLRMPNPNIVAWNVMISGHFKGGYPVEAIKLFQKMSRAGLLPTRSTLGTVLSAITSMENLDFGWQVHAHALKLGLDSNVYVGSSLVKFYGKCQEMVAARNVFDALTEKNDVLWNVLLSCYAQSGNPFEVLRLFISMRLSGLRLDEFTYTSILSANACLENLRMGCQLHCLIIKDGFHLNLFVGNSLVDMYAKSGSLDEARKQFESMQTRDHVSWNAIIVGYVHEKEEDEAFNLFQRMLIDGIDPDEVSIASILSACANRKMIHFGEEIHCFLVKNGLEESPYAASSLIDMYSKSGATAAANKIFSYMPEKNVVSANALIGGVAQKDINSAIILYNSMLDQELKPSAVTYATLLDSINGLSNLELGRQIHCNVLKLGLSRDDEFLAISLLGMYIKMQKNEDASLLFSELPNRGSSIMWTVMISGFTNIDCPEQAIVWYQQMRNSCVMPDQAAFASVLKACSVLASLQDGRHIHALILHSGFYLDELIGSALVDMYAKCGDVASSAQVFREMVSKQDVISWNSMIVGFAKNGHSADSLKIFNEMRKKHIRPDEITFLGVLTACCHGGMVSEGSRIFEEMIRQHGIQPRPDHCACIVDLLGRWGFLEEAEEFIYNLDLEPSSMTLSTYLSACKIHSDDRRGQHAAEQLIKLEPHNSAAYVLLSNLYASSGNWKGVNFVRKEMREKEVPKFPGCSWISLGQETNFFVAGNMTHLSVSELCPLLKNLTALMRDEGSFAETGALLLDEG